MMWFSLCMQLVLPLQLFEFFQLTLWGKANVGQRQLFILLFSFYKQCYYYDLELLLSTVFSFIARNNYGHCVYMRKNDFCIFSAPLHDYYRGAFVTCIFSYMPISCECDKLGLSTSCFSSRSKSRTAHLEQCGMQIVKEVILCQRLMKKVHYYIPI